MRRIIRQNVSEFTLFSLHYAIIVHETPRFDIPVIAVPSQINGKSRQFEKNRTKDEKILRDDGSSCGDLPTNVFQNSGRLMEKKKTKKEAKHRQDRLSPNDILMLTMCRSMVSIHVRTVNHEPSRHSNPTAVRTTLRGCNCVSICVGDFSLSQ